MIVEQFINASRKKGLMSDRLAHQIYIVLDRNEVIEQPMSNLLTWMLEEQKPALEKSPTAIATVALQIITAVRSGSRRP